MPRFNGMGPNGQGPMTGRGTGRCGGRRADGYMDNAPLGRGGGRGRGMGPCGAGMARGRGFGGRGYSVAYDGQVTDIQAEADELRRRLSNIEAQLNQNTNNSE